MGGGPCDFSDSPSFFCLDFGTLDFGTSDLGLTKKIGRELGRAQTGYIQDLESAADRERQD